MAILFCFYFSRLTWRKLRQNLRKKRGATIHVCGDDARHDDGLVALGLGVVRMV